jgi:hypothetical protein
MNLTQQPSVTRKKPSKKEEKKGYLVIFRRWEDMHSTSETCYQREPRKEKTPL